MALPARPGRAIGFRRFPLASLTRATSASGTPRGHKQCLPLSMQILTKRGWLSHDEVLIGDLTVGYITPRPGEANGRRSAKFTSTTMRR
jgi:hypothetical protein